MIHPPDSLDQEGHLGAVAVTSLAAVAVVLIISTVAVGLFRPRPATPDHPGRAARASALAALAACVLVAPWAMFGGLERTLPLATIPLIIALAVTATTGLASRAWPRPSGAVRTASLTPRRLEPATVARLRTGLIVSSGTLWLILLVGLATAAPGGESVRRTWHGSSGQDTGYPGWLYAIPIGVLSVAVIATTWWALRQVEAQPATPDPARDTAYRVRTAARALRGALFGIASSAAGCAFAMGSAVNAATQEMRGWASEQSAGSSSPGYPQPPWDWVQNSGFAVIAVGVVMVLLALYAVSAVPSPQQLDTEARA